ncbi:MAG: phosphate acyltransferase [Candidatus Pacearchaeota archaeon]
MLKNPFFKKIYQKAKKINKKKQIRILFPDYFKDLRIRKAINIIKDENLAIPLRFNKDYSVNELIELTKESLINGYTDAVILGSSFASAYSLKLSFNFIEKGINRISGAMLMFNEKNIFLFSDIAAIPMPTSEQLAEIAFLSAKTFKLLTGKKPRIAFLSYSSFGSGKGEEPLRIKKSIEIANDIFKKKKIDAIIDGEMQADAALVREIAIRKSKEFSHKLLIKGDANVFIFPNLAAGNISYKFVQHLAGWHALGPILQGTSKIINDLSRGCSIDDIVGLTAITTFMTWKKMIGEY